MKFLLIEIEVKYKAGLDFFLLRLTDPGSDRLHHICDTPSNIPLTSPIQQYPYIALLTVPSGKNFILHIIFGMFTFRTLSVSIQNWRKMLGWDPDPRPRARAALTDQQSHAEGVSKSGKATFYIFYSKHDN